MNPSWRKTLVVCLSGLAILSCFVAGVVISIYRDRPAPIEEVAIEELADVSITPEPVEQPATAEVPVSKRYCGMYSGYTGIKWLFEIELEGESIVLKIANNRVSVLQTKVEYRGVVGAPMEDNVLSSVAFDPQPLKAATFHKTVDGSDITLNYASFVPIKMNGGTCESEAFTSVYKNIYPEV